MMEDVISKICLKYLAMIADFDVKCRTIAIDIAFVESVGGRYLPRSTGVGALQHSVE